MNLRQAAQQALEALEEMWQSDKAQSAIIALKQAFAEPEQGPISLNNGRLTQYSDGSIGVGTPAEPEQEPVAWNWMQDGQPYSPAYYGPPPDDDVVQIGLANGRNVRLLYTAFTPRKPLTYDELEPLCEAFDSYDTTQNELVEFARAIERAHGITGETK